MKRIVQILPFALLVLATSSECKNLTEPWFQYLADASPILKNELSSEEFSVFQEKAFSMIPNTTLDTDRPFSQLRRSAKFTTHTEEIGHESHFNMLLYQFLTQVLNVRPDFAITILSKLRSPFCKMNRPRCNSNSRFRTIDGSCNNLRNPFWGASFRAFDRILPAAYEDGFMEPRGGLQGISLPNARKITTTIHYDVILPDFTITNMVPQLGQFLDHDMTLAPEADRHCCTSDIDNRDCWNIQIPADDSFYSTLPDPQTCMDFTRSTPFCFPAGSSRVREQFNILTAFVDASQVYGSDNERARQLRAYQGGRLAVHSANTQMLPTVEEIKAKLNAEIDFKGKYLAGDERVNEMPALTTMHILFVREHNRLADEIQKRRYWWNDNQVFDLARRILIAEWQNVVYGELLPIILGVDTMQKFDLQLNDRYSKYDPNVNPTIFNAFATAAFRFGHTLINGIIQLYRGLKNIGSYELKDNFFESEQVDQNGWDGYNLILGGLMRQNAQTYDPHVTVALTNFVLKPRTSLFGSDLIARNVQRAREHGIPPYNVYRQFCNLTSLTTWNSKPQEILQDTWDKLQSLYNSPADIDLFTGGISELPLLGTVTGATFNCLIATQFHRAKFGDRFFFTHSSQTGSFGANQLKNIRARTLGDIICDNSNVHMTTLNVLRTPSESNPNIFCSDPARNRVDINLHLQSNSFIW